MNDTTTEIVIVLLLILLNGQLSMSELAIVSARKNRLEEMAEDGNTGARTALKLANNPNRLFSTVQIGITLIGILTGAFGGATLADPLAKELARTPWLEPYSQAVAVAIVVITITYFSLVLGELVPKRLALNNPEGIAVRVSQPMWDLSNISTPLVRFLSSSTDLVLRLLRVRPSQEPAVTEEDVQSMISQGTQLGVFRESEQEMVHQVFRLSDRRISTVMTPRTEITFLNADDTQEGNLQTILQSGFSRFPVYRDTPDNVLGIVHVKDLFRRSMTGQDLQILAVLQNPLYVPETMTALDVLDRMKETGMEMALIIDEFGGLTGLVTLNDILEAIVGDVELPQAGEEPEIVRREDGSYLIGGMVRLEELKPILKVEEFPDEEKGYFETLGGMIMTELGRIPSAGDVYEWDGFRFEVVDMDGRRVDKVLVKPKETQSQ
ncbi:MAG TPA: hemolysin family protein [Anaerolineaceae bacterium]|nr:hemolysin family protein [Anaerolineaceae bacterium]